MVTIVVWLLVGFITGWITNLLLESNIQYGAGLNIITAILGSVVGGLILLRLSDQTLSELNEVSFMGAITGAIGSVVLIRLVKH